MSTPTTATWDRPADRLRDSFQTQLDAIRSRTDLNDSGKRARIAKAYQPVKAKMDALAGSSATDKTAAVAQANRTLYGIDDILASASPADKATVAISFRDAQDRAAQIGYDANAAQILWDSAARSGDELLARAVGGYCLDNRLSDVADQFLATHPTQAQALNDLAALQRTTNGGAALFEFILPTPSELSGLTDYQIAALAGQAR